jgi:flagellar motor switch protein FliN/FliY
MAHSRFAANEPIGASTSMGDSDPIIETQRPDYDTLQPGSPMMSMEAEKKERKIDILLDLKLPLNIELGRTAMQIKDILELERGSLIELDKYSTEPVDIWINGKKMAEGEVVVIDKHFGVRITNLVDASERLKGLGR